MALIDNMPAITVGFAAAVDLYDSIPKPAKVVIQNLGPADLWIGGPTVSPTKGIKIISGGDHEDTAATNEELYGITSTGSADVRVLYDLSTPEAD